MIPWTEKFTSYKWQAWMNPKANEPKVNQNKRKQSQPYFRETSNETIQLQVDLMIERKVYLGVCLPCEQSNV